MPTKNSKKIEEQIQSKTRELCALLKTQEWGMAEWAICEIVLEFEKDYNYYASVGLVSEAMMSLKQINDEVMKKAAGEETEGDDSDDESGQPPAPEEADYMCTECVEKIRRGRIPAEDGGVAG